MNKSSSKNVVYVALVGAAFVIGSILAWTWFTSGGTTWGEFGDRFGMINAGFTGLALVGLIATLVHQHNEKMDAAAEFKASINALNQLKIAISDGNLIEKRTVYIHALTAQLQSNAEIMTASHNFRMLGLPSIHALLEKQQTLERELGDTMEALRRDADIVREL